MRLITNSYLHRVISGHARGPSASLLRGILSVGEIFYSSAVRARNFLYDRQILKSHQLPVPVISVGNITAGGTGKTPFVRWLATNLKHKNFHPAILMRGYKRSSTGISDEQSLLSEQLKDLNIPVHANPDRVAGGREILQKYPETDVILLDDGFQHRRLTRDIDIVLIDGTNPLGFNHVHPRGLLREPQAGFRRATALILTRCEHLTAPQLSMIEQELHRYDPAASILRSKFVHNGLRTAGASFCDPPDIPLEALTTRRVFAFAGIANPTPLESLLTRLAPNYVGHFWFQDHYNYNRHDPGGLILRAENVGADVLITTEKDWIKLRQFPGFFNAPLPLWRLDLDLQFDLSDEQRLWSVLTSRINRPQQNRPPQPHDAGENQNRQHHPNPRP
jgi:tetraacyldisaccharide 4'-kinase